MSRILPALAAFALFSDKDGKNQDPERGELGEQGEQPEEDAGADNEEQNYDERYDDDEHDDHDDHDDHDGTDGQLSRYSSRTSTSSLPHTFVRPSLPRYVVKCKDVLFGATHEEQEQYIPNYRTAPIISGAVIPFSILLDIPALTEHWYVRKENGQNVETKSNSFVLTVALGLSMGCAVIANIALLCRFMEKRVKTMTITCIIFLSAHDLINTITVVIFGVQHRRNDGFTYGEAYWMTVCSSVFSMFVNITLIYDLIKTPNFSKSGSGITRKQRSLVIITMIFLTYIALCSLIFSLIMDLTFINGMYFTIVTTLTIGFGDITPDTTGERITDCVLAVFGIIILGAAIRVSSEAIIEGLEVGYHQRLIEFRRHRRERHKGAKDAKRWRSAVEKRLIAGGHEVWVAHDASAPPTPPGPEQATARLMVPPGPRGRPAAQRRGSLFHSTTRLNVEALPPDELEGAAHEAGVPLQQYIARTFVKHRQPPPRVASGKGDTSGTGTEASQSSTAPLREKNTGAEGGSGGTANRAQSVWSAARWARTLHLRKRAKTPLGPPAVESDPHWAYKNTVHAMQQDEKRSLYTKLAMAWILFFIFWLTGSAIFSQTESWSYGTAMYFCFIAFTTIGYGDLSPVTPVGRAVFIVWALFGVAAMTLLIAVISDAFSSKFRRVTHNKAFDRAVERYQEGGRRRKRSREPASSNPARITPMLQANIASLTSPNVRARTSSDSRPHLHRLATVEEAEDVIRRRFEPLPTLILEEVQKFREHIKYFLVANGHTDGLSGFAGLNALPQNDNEVPPSLKALLDDIAEKEGIGERLKEEVWQDKYARNTLFVLGLEKGVRTMIDAAEEALEIVAERNRLLAEEAAREGNSKEEAALLREADAVESMKTSLEAAEADESEDDSEDR